jgi:multiple antibiotic resistance protein
MSVFALALMFFLIVDPIGCIPSIVALIKDYEFKQQAKILLFEAIFSMIIALFFQYFGELFLGILQIKDFAISLTGGILLFLVAYGMIFSKDKEDESGVKVRKQMPFIFPIATPLLSGPGLLTIIMLQSRIEPAWKITLAIVIAWAGVIVVLAVAPFLQKILGKTGLAVLEQVMGIIVAMLAVQMLTKGLTLFSTLLS